MNERTSERIIIFTLIIALGLLVASHRQAILDNQAAIEQLTQDCE